MFCSLFSSFIYPFRRQTIFTTASHPCAHMCYLAVLPSSRMSVRGLGRSSVPDAHVCVRPGEQASGPGLTHCPCGAILRALAPVTRFKELSFSAPLPCWPGPSSPAVTFPRLASSLGSRGPRRSSPPAPYSPQDHCKEVPRTTSITPVLFLSSVCVLISQL